MSLREVAVKSGFVFLSGNGIVNRFKTGDFRAAVAKTATVPQIAVNEDGSVTVDQITYQLDISPSVVNTITQAIDQGKNFILSLTNDCGSCGKRV